MPLPILVFPHSVKMGFINTTLVIKEIDVKEQVHLSLGHEPYSMFLQQENTVGNSEGNTRHTPLVNIPLLSSSHLDPTEAH